MEKEESVFLRQLIESLEESEKKLEDAYNKKDLEEFTKIKNFMMRIQGQIKGVIVR
jgi:hypothetical protein